MKIKSLLLAVLAATILTGCMTEEERRVRAEAERVRREQYEKELKERTRQAKLSLVPESIDIKHLAEMALKNEDESFRTAAVKQLVDISCGENSAAWERLKPKVEQKLVGERFKVTVQVDKPATSRYGYNSDRNWHVEKYVNDSCIIHVEPQEIRDDIYSDKRYTTEDLQKLKKAEEEKMEARKVNYLNLELPQTVSKMKSDAVLALIEVAQSDNEQIARMAVSALTSNQENSICLRNGLVHLQKNISDGEIKAIVSKRIDELDMAYINGSNDMAKLKEFANDSREEIRNVASKRIDELDMVYINGSNDMAKLKEFANNSREEIRNVASKRIAMLKEEYAKKIDCEYDEMAKIDFARMTNGLVALRDCKTKNYVWEYCIPDTAFLQNSIFSMDRRDCEPGKIRDQNKKREYFQKIENEDKPWANVISSRRGASVEDAAKGDALLEEFGNSYMPNAYANLEKAKERVLEIQQMFNDEFAEPWKLETSMPEWTAFEKILCGLMRAKVNYFRLHDELCHYYLMYKVGAVSAEDLASIDGERIAIRLLVEMPSSTDFTKPWLNDLKLVPLADDGCDFAAKNMPETYSIYQKCKADLDETEKLLKELESNMRCMDIVRFDLALIACREKADYTTKTISTLADAIKGWHTEFKIMEKSAEDIAKLDHETAMEWKDFADALPSYMKERANGTIVPTNSKFDKYYPCNNCLSMLCAISVMEPCVPKTFYGHCIYWNSIIDNSSDNRKSFSSDEAGFIKPDNCLDKDFKYDMYYINEAGHVLIKRLNALDAGKAIYSIKTSPPSRYRYQRLRFEME